MRVVAFCFALAVLAWGASAAFGETVAEAQVDEFGDIAEGEAPPQLAPEEAPLGESEADDVATDEAPESSSLLWRVGSVFLW